MFDIGGAEIVLLMILILLVMGPKNLPKVARTLGRFMGNARRVTDEFKSVIGEEIRAMELEEFKKKQEEGGGFKGPDAAKASDPNLSPENEVSPPDGDEADPLSDPPTNAGDTDPDDAGEKHE